MTKIVLVTPTYDGTLHLEVAAQVTQAQLNTKLPVESYSGQTSFLTLQFNKFWCYALNDKSVTHFVMLHADVLPQSRKWLNDLVGLADAKQADVLSAVCRLKREDGATSTALARGSEYGDYRRLTIREAHQLPQTFNAEDVARLFEWNIVESRLLVNTGCMVVRMNRRAVLETMRFTVNNWIRKDTHGKFYPISEPEDWEWSEQAASKGLSVWATTAVPITHKGHKDYDSACDEGLEHDPGDDFHG